MNKFINALLLFLLFPTMAMTIYVGFDLPVDFLKTTGANIPYKTEIFLGLGLLILIINLRRSIRRWMGMRIINQTDRFQWNVPVSSSRMKRIVVYTLLEAFVLGFIGYALYTITPLAVVPAAGYLFCTVDNIIFLLVGGLGKKFRAGVTSKAVIVADRDVVLAYFTGLRRVTIHQDSVYFHYIKDLQLDFPLDCIEMSERDNFFVELNKQIDRDRVFVTTERS
ncbi:MAG: hypothetical protein ACK49D_09100 [Flavobacteriia bacterium]|jgi:hypothetical protein|nr:hypothetical protein [Cryomorphaceae bacterium]